MPENQPLVSVIMNCLNSEKYLKEAIDSVHEQTYKNWEIIFWDNASTDNSAEIAKSYDTKLRYFYGDETIPLGAARNKALEQCQGDYIVFLDCDDILMPEMIEKHMIFLERNQNIVLSYSNICHMYMLSDGTIKIVRHSMRKIKNCAFSSLIEMKLSLYLPSVVINKKLANEELYFRSNYQHAEEYELFLRLSLIGEFGYIDNFLSFYREHCDNLSRKADHYNYIIEEQLDITKRFSKVITEQGLNYKDRISSIYSSAILYMIRNNKKSEVNKYTKFLLRYPNCKNMLIFIMIKLRLHKYYLRYYAKKNHLDNKL